VKRKREEWKEKDPMNTDEQEKEKKARTKTKKVESTGRSTVGESMEKRFAIDLRYLTGELLKQKTGRNCD
jgi:hypothetical protein